MTPSPCCPSKRQDSFPWRGWCNRRPNRLDDDGALGAPVRRFPIHPKNKPGAAGATATSGKSEET